MAKYAESRFPARIYFWRAINFVCSTFVRVIHWSCGCLKVKDRRPPILLGLFLQPHSCVSNFPEIYGTPTPRLLPISDEGKGLAEGALDASLSFIGQTVYIKATSNGVLLCSLELKPPKHYCVCNPVTREWRILPKPNKVYDHVALAFSCQGNEPSLDRLHFTVVQAGVCDTAKDSKILVIETFSSETGEWRESSLACASPFNLAVANCPALVVNNVMYWRCYGSRVVAYDPSKESLELIQAPEFCGGDQYYGTLSDVWAKSEGKIYYARNSLTNFELWRLETNDTTEWFCVARASLAEMFAKRLSWVPDRGEFNSVGVHGVHPYDSRRIFLTLKCTPVWYDIDSGEVDDLNVDSRNICGSVMWDYFMYKCPSVI